MTRMKKTIAILLIVLFLVTMTAGAVSAVKGHVLGQAVTGVVSANKINSPLESYKVPVVVSITQTTSTIIPLELRGGKKKS